MASARRGARRGGEPWRTIAWGVALFAGCRAIQLLLEAQSLAALVAQIVLVEWGAGHIGLAPADDAPSVRGGTWARRASLGLAVGVVASALVIGTLAATRNVLFEPVPRVELSLVGIGLVSACLQAWRDEMLARGVLLRALEHTTVPPLGRVLACGLTSAGLALGRGAPNVAALVVSVELGIVFGALWLWDRTRSEPGRLAAPTAHAAFAWTIQTLVTGGLVQARIAANSWAGGDAGILGGLCAVSALLPMCVCALQLTKLRISPPSA